MTWSKQTTREKVRMLSAQLEEVRKAKELLEHFEGLTEKWLKRLQKAK